MDQTVAPGLEVSMGPGQVRRCAYEACGRPLGWDAPPSKRYCASRCRTADWKVRKGLTVIEGGGDAENARSTGESRRAVELRELRKHGPVASDRRVQVSRATASVAALLVRQGFSEEAAAFYARVAIEDALPARFRR